MTGYVPVSFPLIWGVTALISIYAFRVYAPYKSIRDEIKEIERQFADALFVLGRRISEGRSPEWAYHLNPCAYLMPPNLLEVRDFQSANLCSHTRK